ncbi:MAG: sigma-70 family RNA polymerase sigma factor [Verrucomicrobia bacterium]|nr:sigma-70 family RNA polymerase sigma factor [Verrucomicrobiota bacterium]
MMTDSQRLLVEYAKNGSESAFRELVSRYSNLVYSTALRLVGGDTHLAEDVAQTVFMGLASRGRALSTEVMLGGWLHQHTYHVATMTLRANRRRRSREREAMEMNTLQDDSGADWREVAPILDEAITRLGSEDRTAILLRFFEQRDFRSVGEALGSDEDAARMRVNRALEKLHSLLKHRGVTLSVAALGTALATQAVTAAPPGFATSVAATALASAAASGGTSITPVGVLAMTKSKLGIVGAVVCISLAIPLVIQTQSQAKLRKDNESLRRQLAQLASESERASNQAAQANSSESLAKDRLMELLKLRGEVGTLREQQKELERLRAALPIGQNSQAGNPQSVVSSRTRFPKAAWTFSGYATPEAAIQTGMWALREGNPKLLLASMIPEAQKRLEEDWKGKSEGQIQSEMVKSLVDVGKATEFKIYKQVNISEDEIEYELTLPEPAVEIDSEEGHKGLQINSTGFGVTAKRIGNEWKLNPAP